MLLLVSDYFARVDACNLRRAVATVVAREEVCMHMMVSPFQQARIRVHDAISVKYLCRRIDV